MVGRVDVLSRLVFDDLTETSVQFSDYSFGLHQVFVGDLGNWVPVRAILDLFILVVFHGQQIDFSLELTLSLSLKTIGRIGQDPIMVIATDERVDIVLRLLEKRALEMRVSFRSREIIRNILLTHILEPQLVEVRHIVVHFG